MELKEKFEMNILGEPKEYLGIQIRRDRENKIIKLSQEKFIRKMLIKFCFDQSLAIRLN